MQSVVDFLNSIIWSPVLIYTCLGAGLFYSIVTRFVQVRQFKEMTRLLFSGKSSAKGISSFQALAVSLSGRVGTGNIAGVAAAIGFGGPGAVFWMWVVAFLGAATAYTESTLPKYTKKKITASSAVVLLTTSKKRWDRSGMHGSLPLPLSLPVVFCCRVCSQTASVMRLKPRLAQAT